MAVRNKLLECIQKKERQLGRRVSIIEIERATGVTRATLHNWLNTPCQGQYDSRVITRLCAYFGCGLTDLLELEMDEDEDSALWPT